MVEDVSAQPSVSSSSQSGIRPNFHNRVEREDRISATEGEEDHVEAQYGRGVLPTLLMLLAVVLIATIWAYSSLKKPTADQLYAEILSHPASKVTEQCERYLEAHPDVSEEKTETVKRIYEFGKATKYYTQLSNRLKAKSAMLGDTRLSEIERQFMEIADLAKSDFEEGNIQMDAFVTIHDPDDDLSEQDRECVEAAKSFLLKISEDARRQAKKKLDSINRALSRAEDQNASEAKRTYDSIIKLYGSMSPEANPEVSDRVQQAREKLKESLKISRT